MNKVQWARKPRLMGLRRMALVMATMMGILMFNMFHSQMSTYTATGDTVKTSIGEIQIPKTVKRIIGIMAYCSGGAGLTTLENISGILELETPDLNISPIQLPFEIVAIVGTGMTSHQARVWPVNIPVSGGETITGYATMDQALAINPGARWGLLYD